MTSLDLVARVTGAVCKRKKADSVSSDLAVESPVYDISLSLANDSVSSYINDCVTDGDHLDECTTSSQVNDCVML